MLTGAWILALLAAGAPLVALGGGGGTEDDDGQDDPPDDAEDKPREAKQSDPEDDEAAEETDATGADDTLRPTDYEFILGTGGDHRVDGFRPGTDTLTLTSDSWDFDLYDLGREGDGAALRIESGGAASTLRFPGLDALPVDDIWLHITEPGTEPQRVLLRDTLYPDEDVPLAPTDPDAPETLPPDPSDGPALTPTDPDAPEDPAQDGEGSEVLAPTDPDAAENP